ncbi:TPA: helix-turn-helix domain-containing protein [Streptococcus suis]|uniref:XRE family transcriptional regulator n=1 Tax=Streptococcus suis TaxID=1307 RepID=A0A2I5KLY4_STRSU|nr:helix-turn-helix transcriptional regulator [Streptococcus suis]AUA18368.1 XRE family transcriptional regulator [Streptococcus suis]MBY4974991.1 helix-turn-helix domain-containing protein [Streptococcus suis]MCL4934228.1 helix-turn-helix domain-containing protein [Streptococcus suis]MDG4501527.1 helix-turn-helix domain-containing protein [Streptococcus suis]MDG4510518.1 helix-turn-helix domain-containing protein [Streptococcus suis]
MEQDKLQTFIAKRIRYLRLQKRLSQEKLSELAELGSKHVHNIENGKYNFQIQTLSKIINALEIDEKTFFNFEFPKQDKEVDNVLKQIEQLPSEKRHDIISALNTLLSNINNR